MVLTDSPVSRAISRFKSDCRMVYSLISETETKKPDGATT